MKADNKTNQESVGELEALRTRVAELETQLGLIRTSFVQERIGEAQYWRPRERRLDGAAKGHGRSRRAAFAGLARPQERTQAEMAQAEQGLVGLRESQICSRLLLAKISLGYQSLDGEGKITEVNQALLDILGYSREQVVGRRFGEFLTAAGRDHFEESFQASKSTGEFRNTEFEVSRQDGSTAIVAVHGMVQFDERGEFVQADWIVRDETDRKLAETALRESEEKYRHLVERANDGIAVVQDGLVRYANPSIGKILGCAPDEPLNQPFSNYVHPDVLPTVADRYAKRMLGETAPTIYETVLRHKQGRKIYVELNGGLINYRGKPADLVIVRDVTERKRMEESLKKAHRELANRVDERTEELSKTNDKLTLEIAQRERAERDLRFEKLKFEAMAENSPLGLVMVGEDGTYQYVNRTFTELFGYDPTEVPNAKQWFEAAVPDAEYRQEMISAWVENFRWPKLRELKPRVTKVRCKDGSEKIVSFGSVQLDTGERIVTCRDITEQVRAEQQIKASLKEKEVLLREIHHRVKNNLQVMSSLLRLQARHVKDAGYLRMFQEADHRVRTMALVYEKLDESRNFAELNVRQYVVNLINYLLGACSVPEGRISLKMDVEDATLQIDEAVQLGFIITELFTNCIDHAFVNDEDGEIHISFSSVGDNSYQLVVADNGVGLPDRVDLDHPESIGLDLLRIFVDQLHGSVEINKNNGTQFVITFRGVELRQRR